MKATALLVVFSGVAGLGLLVEQRLAPRRPRTPVLLDRSATMTTANLTAVLSAATGGAARLSVQAYSAAPVPMSSGSEDLDVFVKAAIANQGGTPLDAGSAGGDIWLLVRGGTSAAAPAVPELVGPALDGTGDHLILVPPTVGTVTLTSGGAPQKTFGWGGAVVEPGSAYSSDSAASGVLTFVVPFPAATDQGSMSPDLSASGVLGFAWVTPQGQVLGFASLSSWGAVEDLSALG